MIFHMHHPSAELMPYIESIVYYEGYSAEHRADKFLPDGGIYLIINLTERKEKLYSDEKLEHFQEFGGCFLSGQHKSYIFIGADLASNAVIKFKAGGLFPFLGIPMGELNDKVQQAEPLFGEAINDLRRRILEPSTPTEKMEEIEAFLRTQRRPDFQYDTAFYTLLEQICQQPENYTVKAMAEELGVSQKHLIARFHKQVGLTPKSLLRVFRFQKVIQELEEKGKVDWLQIVTDCGYYDQAHFIRDFYAFSGIRPGLYKNSRGEYTNYLPVA
jgi:AraC-like DNA-binding protein